MAYEGISSIVGQILTNNGAGISPSFQNSALRLLLTQVASNVASVQFTTQITSAYSNYLILYSNVSDVSNGDHLQLQISTNGGISYLATGYTSGEYFYAYNGASGNLNSTTFFYVNGALDNGSFSSGWVFLQNATNGAPVQMTGQGNTVSGTTTYMIQSLGMNTATNINAIQFYMGLGNINTGTFSLYGISP